VVSCVGLSLEQSEVKYQFSLGLFLLVRGLGTTPFHFGLIVIKPVKAVI